MEGIIINYRRGRKTQTTNQMVILIEEIGTKKDAESVLGKSVIFNCTGKDKKKIKGKITRVHGNKGCVCALFERGMPGQAIGQKIEIN